jgi:lysophospholipase L1-like esterase
MAGHQTPDIRWSVGQHGSVVIALSIAVPLLLVLAAVALVVRAFTRFRRLPSSTSPPGRAGVPGRPRVVCLGASTIHGNVSFNIVNELARRLPDHDLINAGVNGNTSAQVLVRVAAVVACGPDVVIIQVGANDALAMRHSPMAQDTADRPTLATFAANLAAIVAGLAPAGARLALMSIQPAGEQLGAEINRDIDRINELVRQTAAAQGASYLPLNERLKELLSERGTGRAATDSPLPVLKAIILHLGLGIGLDRIGRLNGFAVHSDGLHLASPAGLVAADLIEGFVRQRHAG